MNDETFAKARLQTRPFAKVIILTFGNQKLRHPRQPLIVQKPSELAHCPNVERQLTPTLRARKSGETRIKDISRAGAAPIDFMRRNSFRTIRLAAVAILLANWVIACASTSGKQLAIRNARQFAEANGIETKKYSGNVHDMGDYLFITFTRKAWFPEVDDRFAVYFEKKSGEYRFNRRR